MLLLPGTYGVGQTLPWLCGPPVAPSGEEPDRLGARCCLVGCSVQIIPTARGIDWPGLHAGKVCGCGGLCSGLGTMVMCTGRAAALLMDDVEKYED